MPERVVVAMSGGVDSSTAAAILKMEGYDVVGIFMKLWDGLPSSDKPFKTCCAAWDAADARRVADLIGIPFYVANYQRRFNEEVIDYFVNQYFSGRTPNPCILCNSRMKFSHLLGLAHQLGARFLATGHYARVKLLPERNRFVLLKGMDEKKEQSYFLFNLTQEQLSHALFPLGEYAKEEVRLMASRMGLTVADKDESQEVCFAPGGDYTTILRDRAGGREICPGPIRDIDGRTLGFHRGVPYYTIGQRRGLGIAAGKPLYVADINASTNTITVGASSELMKDGLEAVDVNWIIPPEGREIEVKIRYRHHGVGANIHLLDGERVEVRFNHPQRAVTPGQVAVFYNGEMVLGGGWINRALPPRGT